MDMTIEQKVASTILEKEIGSIEIEGEVYKIAPPSIATLIIVSELISTLPVVEIVPKEKITYSVLHHARFFKPLGEIAAVLILGAKNLKETQTRTMIKKRFFGLWKKEVKYQVEVDKRAELTKIILENMRPSVLFDVVVKRLNTLEIKDFFGITTSLSEANILKPTKEVVD